MSEILAFLCGMLTLFLFAVWLARVEKKRKRGIKTAVYVRITGRQGNKKIQVFARRIPDDFPAACDVCSPHADDNILHDGNEPWLCASCFDHLPLGRTTRIE